ncbi:MAG: hypothetical protein M3R59_03180 [Verrucomicrobiota bacterium]|nr:hypothetical protein [Verrucomicrobiota bacterium]
MQTFIEPEKRRQRSQRKKSIPTNERLAFSPAEFASLFGKQTVWGYRQIYNGNVKVITTLGRRLIPRSEVDRILAEAKQFTGETN